jgi:Taurine catabolism dioxygenase TauD, TfdA family
MDAQVELPVRKPRAARAVPMLDHHIEGAQAWTRATLKDSDWNLKIPDAVLAEIRDMVAVMRGDPLPMLLQTPDMYRLPEATKLLARAKQIMDEGVGFVLLDRIPVEEMSEEEARGVYWVLSKLIGRPVAQKWNGTPMMDVRDTGKKPTPGSGVRLSQTSVDLAYHSDNAHNDAPAQYVGLLMLRAAKDGGLSRVKSFYTVHNYLLTHHPEKLKRLYKPMFWDRMREHRPEDSLVFNAPIFKFEDGKLIARLGIIQIRNAYAMIDGGIDKETEQALAAVEEAFDEEESVAEMVLSPGQMQFLNNAIIGHSRTEFFDHDEVERKRHLLRIWLRDSGTMHYRGTAAA